MKQDFVLVVDDERNVADSVVRMLKHIGCTGIAAYDAEEAMEVLRKEQPLLIVSDVIMPGMNGVELARYARSLYPNTKILLISGNAGTEEIVGDARANGQMFELWAKPVPPKQLLTKVASLLSDSGTTVDTLQGCS